MLQTYNKFMVGAAADGLCALAIPSMGIITHDDVINLCAWLLLVSDQPVDRVSNLMKEITQND